MADGKTSCASRATFATLLLILSFGIRLAAVVALRDIHSGPSRSTGGADGVEYDSLGSHVADGLGYTSEKGEPTAFRAPGFPLFLAGIYKVAGHNYPVAYLAICLLGALSCVLTYFLAGEFLSEGTARIAGGLAAIYLPHIYLGTMFETEVLFAPCLALAFLLLVRHLKKPSIVAVGAAGLALSFGTLTRPFALLLLPMLVLILLLPKTQPLKKRLVSAGVFSLFFIALIVPWTIRNDRVLGHPVLLTTNGGSTFYGGNNDTVISDYHYYGGWITTVKLAHRDQIVATPNEVAQDKMEWKIGQDWVRAHLKQMPLLLTYKLIRLAIPDISSPNKKYDALQVVTYTPFMILFMLGMFQCIFRKSFWSPGWLVVHSAIVATIITALIFWGAPRFRDAIAPILMIYVSIGFETIYRRIRK